MLKNDSIASKSILRAICGLTLGALIISFSGVWVKLSHITPTASAFYRVLIGGIFLLLGALWRREIHAPTRRQAARIVLCGAFLSLDLMAYHYSILYVGPGLGTILPNFQVFIMAAVGALIYKESLGRSYLWSIPLAVGGLFLVVGIQWGLLGEKYKIGVYLGLAAAACYSAFLLFLRKLQADNQRVSFFYVLMAVSLISAVLIAAEMYHTGDDFAIPDLQTLLSLAALGILCHGIGWILISNALPRLRISLSGLILLLQPALAFLWDVLFFSRPTSGLNWLGVLIVLSAIYMGTLGSKSTKLKS